MTISAFMIAGTGSGCGKTTISMGIMAALAARGLCVQPFKAGPDFIDPGHHRIITGRDSHNLDGWMMDKKRNQDIFCRYSADADVAVAEGVMGLFDGFSGKDETGSSAQMAKWLSLPVILVIDSSSAARSVAAVALGFRNFDPALAFAGVILNRVAGQAHEHMLKEAFTSVCNIPVLGCFKRDSGISIPSRHLGLVTAKEIYRDEAWIKRLAVLTEKSVDINLLLSAGKNTKLTADARPAATRQRPVNKKIRIGIATDEAFCFYYPENIRLLEEAGAEMVRFSPLKDHCLPAGISGLILGGGYPELHCKTLSGNQSLLREIGNAARNGLPVYAECGGFMFLMKGIKDIDGGFFEMTALFPFRCVMEQSLKALGYREVTTRKDSIIGPAGTVIRGHEFHYSALCKDGNSDSYTNSNLDEIYKITDRKGEKNMRGGFLIKHVLASYIHLHWGSNPGVAKNFVEFCRKHG